MKNPLKKAKTEKTRNKNSRPLNVFIVHSLLFTFIAIFILGCVEAFQITPAPAKTAVIGANQLQLQAIRIIRDFLADENPRIRVMAIEVVADTKQIRLMPKVQRLLRDELVPVRFAAAVAIGDSQYKLARSSIRRLLKDRDENVRIAAAYAMGKLGSHKYFEVLRKAIVRSDLTVRANAALLMGKSDDKNSLRFLYWVLQYEDSDDKVRFNAIQAIATLGDERILSKLWAMRISAYADDRVMSIEDLGALGTEKAKNVLITMLDDDILEVRLAAAEQLGVLGSSAGESEVLSVFEKNLTDGLDKQDLARVYKGAALAIGRIGTPSLKKFLPQLLKDQSKLVRIAAAKAILQCTKTK